MSTLCLAGPSPAQSWELPSLPSTPCFLLSHQGEHGLRGGVSWCTWQELWWKLFLHALVWGFWITEQPYGKETQALKMKNAGGRKCWCHGRLSLGEIAQMSISHWASHVFREILAISLPVKSSPLSVLLIEVTKGIMMVISAC